MIIGGTVTKVSAERMSDGQNEGMDINIQVRETKFEKTKATVKYTYEVSYKPNQAKLSIEGEAYLENTEKEMKDAKEYWEKHGQLPEALASDLLTAVTYTASATGTLLAFAVNIAAPINVPRARLAPKEATAKPAA